MEDSELIAKEPNLSSLEFDGELINNDRLEYYAKLNYKSFLEMADKIKDFNNEFYNETVIPVIKKYEKRYEKRMEERTKNNASSQYRKYGWGWYILLGIYYRSLWNMGLKDIAGLIALIAIVPMLILYFYLRNKILMQRFRDNGNVGNVYSASFLSGIITCIMFQLLTGLTILLISIIRLNR